MSSVTNSGINWYYMYCAVTGAHQTTGKEEGMDTCKMFSFMHFHRKRKLHRREKSLNFFAVMKTSILREKRGFSSHFMDGKPTSEDPYPELFANNNIKENRKVTVLYNFMFHLKITVHFAHNKCIGMIFIFLFISSRSSGV